MQALRPRNSSSMSPLRVPNLLLSRVVFSPQCFCLVRIQFDGTRFFIDDVDPSLRTSSISVLYGPVGQSPSSVCDVVPMETTSTTITCDTTSANGVQLVFTVIVAGQSVTGTGNTATHHIVLVLTPCSCVERLNKKRHYHVSGRSVNHFGDRVRAQWECNRW